MSSCDERDLEELSEEDKKRFARFFKQAIESDDFNFVVSYIEKIRNLFLSMSELIHLPLTCRRCPLHCFQVLDKATKNRVGRPRKMKGV